MAGLENEQPTAVVHCKERFAKYQEFMEENFRKAQEESLGEKQEETKQYSSKEAKQFVETQNADTTTREAYEKSQYTSIRVDIDKIMYDESDVICLQTEDGLLRGVMVDSMDERFAEIFIRNDNSYSLVQPDGKQIKMSGAEIIDKNAESIVDSISKAAGRKGR